MEKPILQLVVEKGPKEGEALDCRPGALIHVGRVVRGNTFAIRDPGISQKHLAFEFLPAAARWAVTDLATSNGTLVNGRPIPASAPFHLFDGDCIKIGEATSFAVKIGGERDLPGKDEDGGMLPRRGRSRRAPPPPPPPPPLDSAAEDENSEASPKIGGRGKRARKKPAPLARVSKKEEVLDTAVKEEIVEEENAEAPVRNGGRGRGVSKKPAPSDRILKKDGIVDAEVAEESIEEESREEIARNGRASSKKAAPSSRDSEKDEILDAAVVMDNPEEDNGEASARNVGRGRGRRRKAAASARFSKKHEILDTVAVEDSTQEPKNEVKGRGRGRRIATRASARHLKEQDVVEPSISVPVIDSEAVEATEKGNLMAEGDAVNGMKSQENGDEEVRAEEGLDDMEKMTLGEWFDRMERSLPLMINDIADEIISNLREKARLFDEFIATSANAC